MKAILLISLVTFCCGQSVDSSVLYQKAINTVDGDKALEIYEQIIQLNDNSDYYWLSILKKAELRYAIGSYIHSSTLLKELLATVPVIVPVVSSILVTGLTITKLGVDV